MRICTCEICGNIKIVKKCILPIWKRIKHSFAKIVGTIKEEKVLKPKCSKCDKEHSRTVRINVSYGGQLFIESSIITILGYSTIYSIKWATIRTLDALYTGKHTQTSVGDYTMYVRNGTNE